MTATDEIRELKSLADRGPFAVDARQRKRMERDAGWLATDYSYNYVRQFVAAGIGVVFLYTSDVPEWGSDYVRYALGPKGSTAAQVRALLDEKFVGDDWKWKIERLPAPKPPKHAAPGHGARTLDIGRHFPGMGKWTPVPQNLLPPDYPSATGFRNKRLDAAIVNEGNFWWLHKYDMKGVGKVYRTGQHLTDKILEDIKKAAPSSLPVGTRVGYSTRYAGGNYAAQRKHHGVGTSGTAAQKEKAVAWMLKRRGVVKKLGPFYADHRSLTIAWDDGETEDVLDKDLKHANGSPAKRSRKKPKRPKPTVTSARQSLRQSIRRDK